MTAIEWTRGDDGSPGETWNPTTGCDRVSPGCDNCYALTLAKRLKAMGSAKYQRDGDPRTSGSGFGLTTHDDALDLPLRWRKPRRVFVNSMSDLFHKDVPDGFIASVFAIMAATPQHVFQILTKRHGRLGLLASPRWAGLVLDAVRALPDQARGPLPNYDAALRWAESPERAIDLPPPLPNVHLGVSVEDQKHAELRIHALRNTPAALRFLSCEPLLAPVDLAGHLSPAHGGAIGWVVVGGESGSGARPMELDWVRSIVNQCRDAGVPVFVKQLGSVWAGSGKGGDMDAWPADLRVREFPAGAS